MHVDEVYSDLAASLELLNEALEDPDVDFAADVAALTAAARNAVHSYLGLTIIFSGDPAVAITVFAEPGPMPATRASLRMPMPGNDIGDVGVVFILYASQPGAFVDLAADLAWMSARTSTQFVLDQHLQPHAQPDGTVTLRDAMLINQAIGVLISRGATPDAALRDIDALTARDGIDRTAAAASILATLTSNLAWGHDQR